MDAPLKIGIVPFLNAYPLVRGLDREFPDALILPLVPSDLARSLADGGIDVALVSSIVAGEDSGYLRLGEACIASRSDVVSVQIFHQVPVKEIRRVGLDTASRTSVVLGRIILERHLRLAPEYVPLEENTDFTASGLDAAVVIGDRTFELVDREVPSIDLGRAWREYSGLPFVYAFWTGRRGRDWARIGRRLENVRDRNLEEMETMVREASERWKRPVEFCRSYLTRNVYHRFGPEEAAGLKRFYQEAEELAGKA